MPSEIFATHPLAHWSPGPQDPLSRTIAVSGHSWTKGHFAELLLQHDVVTLPTADCSIVAVLLYWFGEDILCDMLVDDAVRFVRYYGSIGYDGESKAICNYEIWPNKPDREKRNIAYVTSGNKDTHFYETAAIVSTGESAELYLTHVFDKILGPPKGQALANLVRLVEKQTIDAPLFAYNQQVNETLLRDISRTKRLREFVKEDTGGTFRDVPIDANQMRAYGYLDSFFDPASMFDQLDLLIWMAAAQYELAIAQEVGSQHVLVENPVRDAIVRSARRSGVGESKSEEFAELLEATGIPSIPDAVGGGLDIRDVWRLRCSRDGIRFREWFNAALDEGNYPDLKSAYIRELSSPAPWISRIPVRSIRLLADTGVGYLLNPVAGIASSVLGLAIDEAVEKKNWTPKVFVENLRRIVPDDAKVQ